MVENNNTGSMAYKRMQAATAAQLGNTSYTAGQIMKNPAAATSTKLSFNYSPYVGTQDKDLTVFLPSEIKPAAATTCGKASHRSTSSNSSSAGGSASHQQLQYYLNQAFQQQQNLNVSQAYGGGSMHGITKAASKLDFTQIIQQLSQPSTVETPTRTVSQQQEGQNLQALISVQQKQSSHPNQLKPAQDIADSVFHLDNEEKVFANKYLNSGGVAVAHGAGGDSNRGEVKDSKESTLAIQQLNDLLYGQPMLLPHREIQPSSYSQTKSSSYHFQQSDTHERKRLHTQQDIDYEPREVRMNINDMVSQLDDLQDQIKCFEQKLDYTDGKRRRQQRSPSSSSRERKSSQKPTKLSSSVSKSQMLKGQLGNRKASELSCSGSTSKAPASSVQNPVVSSNKHRSRSKNISWGESKVYPHPPQNNKTSQPTLLVSSKSKQHSPMILSQQQSSINIDEFRRQKQHLGHTSSSKENQQPFSKSSSVHRSSAISKNSCSISNIAQDSRQQLQSSLNLLQSSGTGGGRYTGVLSSHRSSVNTKNFPPSSDRALHEVLFPMSTDTNLQSTYELLEPAYSDPTQNLPMTLKGLLNEKIKEVDDYKEKCTNLRKALKHAKAQLAEKDMLLGNFKSLQKELKILKEQWRMSEDIREDQKRKMQKLQGDLIASQKETFKLRKKVHKLEKRAGQESDSMHPIKVIVSGKREKCSQKHSCSQSRSGMSSAIATAPGGSSSNGRCSAGRNSQTSTGTSGALFLHTKYN